MENNEFFISNSQMFTPQSYLCNQSIIETKKEEKILMQPFKLKNCKYSIPTRELLDEFCSLKGERVSSKRNPVSSLTSYSWNDQFLSTMNPLELQKRKTLLSSLLEVVHKRYRRYHEQISMVSFSFEAATGNSAMKYTELASKAMSQHFRCLKDAITRQIHATRRALGERDVTEFPGATRGETPRLKLLDHKLRQKRANFQQGGLLGNPLWRPQRGLPESAVSILRAWLFEHFLNPYPSDVDKRILARQTGLSRSQVSNWFINARVRLWKPMIEEIYMKEIKQQFQQLEDKDRVNTAQNPNPNPNPTLNHRPIQEQKLAHDPSSLLSPINSNTHFTTTYNIGHVSLTLGLQGRGERTKFPFASPIHQDSINQQDDFSMLEEEAHHPYRNLLGAELLHDMAR